MCRESSTSQHFLLHKPFFTYLTSSLVNSTFPHLIPDKQLWLSYSMPHILWIFLIDVMAEIFHFCTFLITLSRSCTQLPWSTGSPPLPTFPLHVSSSPPALSSQPAEPLSVEAFKNRFDSHLPEIA